MKTSLIHICLSVMLTVAVVNAIGADTADQYRPPLPKKLSLEEAKKIALQANPSLQVTVARLQAAAAQLQQAQSNYMPTLDLTASVQRTQEVPKQNGGNGRTHFTTYNAGASFDWTLYDGMARKYDNIAKRVGMKIAEFNHEDAQRSLLLSVATAYYDSLLEVENIRIAKEDLKYNIDLQDTAQKKLERGAGNRSDVLNFQIKAKGAQANLIQAEQNLKIRHYTLVQLLGYSPSEVPEGFELISAGDYSKDPALPSIEECIAYAMEHRPDIMAQNDIIERQTAMVDYYGSDNHPQIGLFADYGLTRRKNPKFTHHDDSLVFGAQVRWNVFNGNKTRARVAEAYAGVLEARASLDALKQDIEKQVANQHVATNEARTLADLKTETEKLAEETRDLVRTEYNIGRVTATRLNEAQTDLTNAQAARVKAIILYWQYRENLAASTGKIMEPAK
jgi:outer membrane protein TolC